MNTKYTVMVIFVCLFIFENESIITNTSFGYTANFLIEMHLKQFSDKVGKGQPHVSNALRLPQCSCSAIHPLSVF